MIVDIRCYNGWSLNGLLNNHTWTQIKEEADRSGDEIVTYYNIRRMPGRPEFSRVTIGLWFWLSPLSRTFPWKYRMPPMVNSSLSILGYTYPPESPSGEPIPSLRWEGFREGVDDFRYLYTLQATIDEAQKANRSSDSVAKAEAFLDSLRQEFEWYGMTASSIAARLDGDDYQRIRLTAARMIMGIPEIGCLGFVLPLLGILALIRLYSTGE